MRGTLCFCVMLLIASAATVPQAKASAVFPFSVCYEPDFEDKVSTAYKQSVNSLLLALRHNASLTGFAAAIAGQPPNRVYGTILCYGDASSEDCRGCISNATEGVDSRCESWIMWYDYCMVRYSPWNSIGVLDTENVFSSSNNDSPAASDPVLFNQQLLVLLSNLTATATGNRSAMEYAAGNISVTAGQTIHGFVLCRRDISLNDCRSCLANLTSRIETGWNGTDVFISSPTCIIKYRVPEPASSSSSGFMSAGVMPAGVMSAGVGLQWTRSSILAAMISTFCTAAFSLTIPHAFSL